ncbi:unnamed protein product [Phyllotreta striolata]|uniref:Selenoprotein M n=1 Tax=Phyllotreta striolata TaxID=444603 RepID=A0A9N9THN8_PHYSR|nr:unnamed protein product [Phyllotreta striolata]
MKATLLLLLAISFYSCVSGKIVKARLESCPGCSLNRLHEVRKFAYEDLPMYEGVEWKKISGAPPELVFLDENDKEVERYFLKELSRKECNGLLQQYGFKQKSKEL